MNVRWGGRCVRSLGAVLGTLMLGIPAGASVMRTLPASAAIRWLPGHLYRDPRSCRQWPLDGGLLGARLYTAASSSDAGGSATACRCWTTSRRCCWPRVGRTDDEHPAPDGPGRSARAGRARAPSGQALAAEDCHGANSSTVPGRLIEHGRQLILGLGANDRAAKAFTREHGELFAACG